MVNIQTFLRFTELFNRLERYLVGRLILLMRKVPPHVVTDADAWKRVQDWMVMEIMNLDLEKFDKDTKDSVIQLTELRAPDLEEDYQDEYMIHARMLAITLAHLWNEIYILFTDSDVNLGKKDGLRVLHGFLLETISKLQKPKLPKKLKR